MEEWCSTTLVSSTTKHLLPWYITNHHKYYAFVSNGCLIALWVILWLSDKRSKPNINVIGICSTDNRHNRFIIEQSVADSADSTINCSMPCESGLATAIFISQIGPQSSTQLRHISRSAEIWRLAWLERMNRDVIRKGKGMQKLSRHHSFAVSRQGLGTTAAFRAVLAMSEMTTVCQAREFGKEKRKKTYAKIFIPYKSTFT